MKKCKVCEGNLWINPKKRFGLCKSCYEDLKNKIFSMQKVIDEKALVVDNAVKPLIRIQNCNEIVDLAKQYLSYEEMGMQTLNPNPSEMIRKYIARHDEIIVNLTHDRINAAFLEVEKILKPFGMIYIISDLLKRVGTTRENLSQFTKYPVIVALINQKGGVGKTTSSINIGAGLSRLGKNVLLIDFDPQSNLTEGLGIRDTNFKNSIYEVLKGEIKYKDAIMEHGDLSIIPANVLLARIERDISGEDKDIFLLRNALKGLNDYDFVLIDCLPSLGILTLNALAAANEIFVPIQPEYFSVSGISKITDAMNYINEKFSEKIEITGIICTFWDQRKSHSREVISHIREKYNDVLFNTFIRDNVSLVESGSFGKTIFEYLPNSHGAEDYIKLCSEILNKIGNHNKPTL